MDTRGLRRGNALSWLRCSAAVTVLVAVVVACGETDGTTASPPSEGGQLTASPEAATPAVLVFDAETCRNSGTVKALGVVWELVDPMPFAWQKTGDQEGRLTVVDDRNATFAAADGTELRVTIGPHEEECFGWDGDED